MKKGILVLSLLLPLLFCACHKQEEPVPVMVTLTNLNQPQEKSALSEAVAVKSLSLSFFRHSDHVAVFCDTQHRSDFSMDSTQFGVFGLTLSPGTYDMVAVGWNSDSPMTIRSYTEFNFGMPLMVFVAVQTVTVSSFGNSNLSAELHRVSSQLKITPTDTIPDWADRITFSYSASGVALNPFSGLSTTNTGVSGFLAGLHSHVGQIATVTSNLLLYQNEQIMNVTIEVYDNQGSVAVSKTIENVPFVRNRRTHLTGALYHQSASTGFTIDLSWLDDYEGGGF